MSDKAWQKLGDYLQETKVLGSIHSTLYWDQNTAMPALGAEWRGAQLSLLARSLHSRQTSDYFQELLINAKEELQNNNHNSISNELLAKKRNLELLDQEITRQKKLDPELVSQISAAQANGYALWQQAKLKNDFQCFKPALKKLILLRQEQAKQLNEQRSCWETLAQPFEPDLTIKRLDELFEPLKKCLPELIDKYSTPKNLKQPKWDLSEKSQQALCDRLLNTWGRDNKLTSLARSPHPFSITLGPKDFRLTTRVVPGQPLSCFLATAHEWGHSLYEQGLPAETHQWFAWPLGQATSMAVHESQSLFWENRVARSKEFANRFWKYFEEAGAPLQSGDDLWRQMNPLTPGLNRVEADELSYGLHILIRTELEISLLEDGLEVDAIPSEWNKKYRDLIGIEPTNDSEGCLQDVHWSEGAFGYFPSYLIGHLISAQLAEAMILDLDKSGIYAKDPIGSCILEGSESELLSWLRKEVHHFGRQVNAEQLVEKVTKKPLSSEPFLKYLQNKLEQMTSTP
ncbi:MULTISPECIES: carboxypeptidase M32 [Prochlorococcus]|uniref:carboxypeptidase M32 n=1 Tax=Prochlorococcus TaxID=1218 RepID=UPI0005338669|nr:MULTISPECIES: carboxypeptidase M32 [Prochlorococcus]KGG12899.1 Thermostable carboxypeptidase 1 [Prochlorococcus sp. MIT 0601]